jgi:hypothetical protein
MDGSTIQGYQWTQTASAEAAIEGADTPTPSITLGDEAAYRAELIDHIQAPDRWMIQGVNPFSLEEAGHVAFEVAVTTSSGVHKATVDVHAHLDHFAVVSTGLRNVPVGLPVFFRGKKQDMWDWTITTRPAGSTAALNDGALQFPTLTPDVIGRYVVTVTELPDNNVIDIEFYAALWRGVIVDKDENDRPIADVACTQCHNDPDVVGEGVPDLFVYWSETGHAEIFTDNLNTSAYWGERCFACHTVGYNPGVDNGGIDEAPDYPEFLKLLGDPKPENWETALATTPATAQLANIQCENCHGPQLGPTGETAHMQKLPRVDISSDVCATCHGEPKRHARFQQWERSGHANYALALDEGWEAEDGEFRSCGACHTGNGFIDWVKNGGGDADYDVPANLISGPDEIHPQTCATCHDPHDVGTTSGSGTNAPVRIQGDTPMLQAGFKAVAVGKGALCMTCHNARRGLRNDHIPWADVGDKDRYPHGRPNADIVMGQNAYFVSVGLRARHSLIEDTCVKCHMDLTDPPEDLSYNLGGTNHTFAASAEICSECHGTFTAATVKAATETNLDLLETALVDTIYKEIDYLLERGYKVFFKGTQILDIDQIKIHPVTGRPMIALVTYHGRQAMDVTLLNPGNPDILLEHVRMAGDTKIWEPGNDPDDPGEYTPANLLDSSRGEIIGKAGWNYWAVDHDGSYGIHNPSFTDEMLNKARIALLTIDFEPPIDEDR